MNESLWTEASGSDSTQRQQQHATDASDVSPIQAAIDASSWTRADVELALDTLKVVLLAAALYYGVQR